MKSSILLSLAALFSTTVLAAPESYIIDNTHTLPRFSYNHMGYSTQLSRFDKTTGKIVLDREAHTGSVDVNIDATSVSTGSALFNEHIQGVDFLDTAHYPTMTFTSNKLNFQRDTLVSVEGTLTLKGISKPVTLTVTSFQCMPNPILMKNACGANATTLLKRTDFNMGKYAPFVSDEVTVTIPVEAIKE
ncbi:YceI family protein [Methylocucumis oryzae]|uniref:Polyisoprenoid-binding protein n=1 Tax=Methylocucumis oryzae TaxID=1632867 RepID=A0A0F3IFL9_9GAMM|nr:YceI family protein [Methylocucumis oryzae]KJV05338.1 polyisoprenoid-binding protein [Methylocucumis oryzae]